MVAWFVALGFCLLGCGVTVIVAQVQNTWLPNAIWPGPLLGVAGTVSFLAALVLHRRKKIGVANSPSLNQETHGAGSPAVIVGSGTVNLHTGPTLTQPVAAPPEIVLDSGRPPACLVLRNKSGDRNAFSIQMDEVNGPDYTLTADPIASLDAGKHHVLTLSSKRNGSWEKYNQEQFLKNISDALQATFSTTAQL
jgi:hypothetical protein